MISALSDCPVGLSCHNGLHGKSIFYGGFSRMKKPSVQISCNARPRSAYISGVFGPLPSTDFSPFRARNPSIPDLDGFSNAGAVA